MDKQRIQAYLDLIQQLLSCAEGEEPQVLQHHSNLVDIGLVQAMGQVAETLRQQGQVSRAHRLENMANQISQIAQVIGEAGAKPNAVLGDLPVILLALSQPVRDMRVMAQRVVLCQQALGLVSRNNNKCLWAMLQNKMGNSLLQNPLGNLGRNIEDAILAYDAALEIYTQTEFPKQWASTQNNLANAYSNRILGDRSEDIEKAISAYKRALEVRTRIAFPEQWASTQVNLANAYQNRICGNRAQNIEDAITIYKKVIEVYRKIKLPEQWARTQNNLATAYRNRIFGSQAQNIEDAITAYKLALEVRTRDRFPQDWAMTQNNLAVAYCSRIQGDRARNIEDAIIAFEQALEVYTCTIFPEQWAMIYSNLATAYRNRIRGDRAQNIEDAIIACQHSLEIYTRTDFPEDWAMIQHNLATAYRDRILGDFSENLEKAIIAYQQVLEVYTRTSFPEKWAATQNNLATTYCDRIKGNHAQNIENAITACNYALEVYTPVAFPEQWAMTQNTLATAFSARIWGNHAQNMKSAITAYEQSLQVYTFDDFPEKWAATQNNLATTYSSYIQGDFVQSNERAIAAYQNALQVYDPNAYPNDCRRTSRLLANLYASQSHWDEAKTTYQTALIAAESLYQSAFSKSSQESELSEISDLYRRAAYAYAKTGDLITAVATIEQGRARSLSETLQRDRADLDTIRQINSDLADRYQTAANIIQNLESIERHNLLDRNQPQYSRADFRQQASQAHHTLKVCITEIRQIPGYEMFLALPTFEDVAAAVQPHQPLVYLLHTPSGSLALVLFHISPTATGDEASRTRQGITVTPIWLNALTDENLMNLLNNAWLNAYGQSQENRQDWLKAINQVTSQLWDWIMAPLLEHLQHHKILQVTLIPTGYLSLLPLHAAWAEDPSQPTGCRYALDYILITYAPNAQVLAAARAVANQVKTHSILAVENPSQDLPNSEREVQAVLSSFPLPIVLRHEQATLEQVCSWLLNATIVHFSCHGFASFQTPLNSGLLMAYDEILTLRDILDLKIKGMRLAVLSACETSIPGVQLPDEVVNLPTGLLQAGVAGVVASLWTVSDLSTMLLITRFYDLWRNAELEPPAALAQAQQWVRDTTNQQKYDYLKRHFQALASQGHMSEQEVNLLLREFMIHYIYGDGPNSRSFAHPFHWAAFSYTGV